MRISIDNKIVHGLWIGDKLSPLELLTIRSFIKEGHEFHLWTYSEIITDLPKNLVLQDANLIIPEENVFSYSKASTLGHGKGSFAGFSDIFRYKLLYEKGGWYTDMDITCLKPLNFQSPYFFRSHPELNMVGNLMKCPKGSQLMLNCYNLATQSVDHANTDWMKPIRILNEEIAKLGLSKFIFKNVSNNDWWDELVPYLQKKLEINSNYYFIHWMNEEWRWRKIDKEQIRANSSIGHLLQTYNLPVNTKFFRPFLRFKESGIYWELNHKPKNFFTNLTKLTFWFFVKVISIIFWKIRTLILKSYAAMYMGLRKLIKGENKAQSNAKKVKPKLMVEKNKSKSFSMASTSKN